jgi:glucose/arabinose dehydrogenase
MMRVRRYGAGALVVAAGVLLTGCYALLGSSGGGETGFSPPRLVRAADIAVVEGYRVEPVATGLTYPTGVAFDGADGIYVVEAGYSYGEDFTAPRLLRVDAAGGTTPIAVGENAPWNGVTYGGGAFFVAEGGVLHGGRILRIGMDGGITPLVEGLPSMGDHHTNGPVLGPDGRVYFGQGTVTNSAVVGEDNYEFGWLPRFPELHDVPCRDVTLAGQNHVTWNPLTPSRRDRATTGAFVPFGTPTARGQVVPGRVPCSGSVLRVSPAGGPVELVAWGFRNPFGLAFSPAGVLFVTDNSYDNRGSRSIWGAGDLLWRVAEGGWYGWPDFHAGRPVTDADHYRTPGREPPRFVLADHPAQPPLPAAVLGVHSSSNGLDFSRNPAFGYVGDAFIAQFGDMAPAVGKVMGPVGFKVVRVEVETGVMRDFAVNRARTNGPASRLGGGGLERPVAARFDPSGTALYVVDFGVMTIGDRGPRPHRGTGVLWRITREGTP